MQPFKQRYIRLETNFMGKIRLIRNNSFNNKLRKIDVFLNNEKVREISNNEIVEIMTDKKDNSIYVKLDWFKSETLKLDLENDSTIELQIVNIKTKNRILKLIISLLILAVAPFWSEFNLFFKSILIVLTTYIVFDLLKFLWSLTKYSKNKYISLEIINNVA